MSLEISLSLYDLDSPKDGSESLLKGFVKSLKRLHGILDVRHDTESRRFAIKYDPNLVSVVRILYIIELVGRRTGSGYRPTDVRTKHTPARKEISDATSLKASNSGPPGRHAYRKARS
ncbi:MAG: hypothetical protein ACREI5_03550 [Candidatus Methylomirabilales bacterium]